MPRHNCLTYLLSVVIVTVLVVFPIPALCRLNLPELEGHTVIEGRDHQMLEDFFARFQQEDMERSPGGEVKRILLGALPEAYKDGCTDMVAHWGPAADGTEALSVRVLHVEEGDKERSVRALLAYACFSRAKEYVNRFRDERLAALVVDRKVSRLSMMPDDGDCENCQTLTRILPEKEVHIAGKCVVGLSVLKTGENPCCALSAARKEERVNFYLMQDNGVKPAGSVLKGREEYAGTKGAQEEKTVYSASVIFKKDMKGNIIGILSPYTVVKNARRSGKGMVRYDWNSEREEFVKGQAPDKMTPQ
jgi:hypothetical protein